MAGELRRSQRQPQRPLPAQQGGGAKFYEMGAAADGDKLEVPLDDITPNPFNDRDLGDVTHLAESIAQDDLLQEITVMHTSAFAAHWPQQAEGITTTYVLAFGERRWRAHKELGRPTIAAVLRNSAAPKIRRVLFAENFHRKQLSPIEEARKFHVLNTEEQMSYRAIVEELKLTGPNYVSRRIELLDLPPELQAIVGTDNGPGVTLARNIKGQFVEAHDQICAWELIRDEGLTLAQAVTRIRDGEAVPPGNTMPEDAEDETAPVPPGNITPEDEAAPVPLGNTTASTPEKRRPTPTASGKRVTAADKEAVERNHAAADRDPACRSLAAADKLTPEQHAALIGRTLLAPIQHGPARTRAHKWLRDEGAAGFDISDTDSYFEAVLSSGQSELVNRVVVATAIAAGEVRARDGRRQWDKVDAEHVRLLIEATGYVPETAWERTQLTRFGVPFDGNDDPDPEPIS
ncbi:ParB/RepB/Spo0J family partition protein [Streptomyces sp. NPDC093223]|uniref:ParB/RepB/Spo0J family partition protein n=1 Tax=Streptomyces sp. NPDC093223 TaxID=3366033 RepID=UPI00382FDE3C